MNFIFKNHLFLGTLNLTVTERKGMLKFHPLLRQRLRKTYNERFTIKHACDGNEI
jgi:hypothetical protein